MIPALLKHAKTAGVSLFATLILIAVQTDTIKAQSHTDSLYQIAHNPDVPSSDRLIAYRDYILATLYSNTADALPDLQDYLQMSTTFADSVRMAHAYHCLGFYYRKSGQLDRADTAIARSLRIAQGFGNYYYQINAYIDQALMLEERGHFTQARRGYASALDTARHYEQPVMEARCLINLGNLEEVQGNYPRALEHLQKALALCEKQHIVGFMASTLLSLGNINAAIGENDQAELYYQRAIKASRSRSNNNTLQLALIEYARLMQAQEKTTQARQLLLQLLNLSNDLPSLKEVARAHYLLADHYNQYGQPDSAQVLITEAIRLLAPYPESLEYAYGQYTLGTIKWRENQPTEAEKHCQEAYRVNQQYADIQLQKSICHCLHETQQALGKPADALRYYQEYIRLVQQQTNTSLVKELIKKQLENQHRYQLQLDSLNNQRTLDLVQLRHDRQLQEQRRILWLILTASLLLAALAFTLYYVYRQNRKQKQSLEKMDRLNKQVFSIITHDFKGPLLSMNIMAERLANQQMNEAEIKMFSADIHHQVAQTTHIIDNLLNWARSELQLNLEEKREVKPKDIAQELTQTFAQKLQAKNLTLINQLPENLTVVLHPDLLRIVFRNLLSNAIKFSYDGGSIVLEYRSETRQIMVHDEGVGLAAEQKKHLFKQPLYSHLGTHHETGFGIGLCITAELLDKNQWKISATSRPEGGTTFILTHPENGG